MANKVDNWNIDNGYLGNVNIDVAITTFDAEKFEQNYVEQDRRAKFRYTKVVSGIFSGTNINLQELENLRADPNVLHIEQLNKTKNKFQYKQVVKTQIAEAQTAKKKLRKRKATKYPDLYLDAVGD